ncbi:MAG: hypothetical protein IT427_18990, partial [Pirellulales bacterium]|nr:hypothetical protein [Pirellulales bacterium]
MMTTRLFWSLAVCCSTASMSAAQRAPRAAEDGGPRAEVANARNRPGSENGGERLYNGIVLPEEWPPRNIDPRDVEPMRVPYLESPPAVIPIDVGRQLFVDDFLIEKTDLARQY